MDDEVFGGTPNTARGTRALPDYFASLDSNFGVRAKLGGTERGSIISLEPVDQEHEQVNGKLEPATERLEKPGKKPEQVSCLTSGSVTGTSQPPGSRPD